MNRRILNGLLIALSALTMNACVPVPIALPDAKPFKDITKEFLIVGSTLRSDVAEKLGEPDLQANRWWLYRDTREGWQWLFCVGGGYSAGCGPLPRGNSDYFLVIDFDDGDVVSAFDLLTENELCDARQICYEGPILMQAAGRADDTEAKLFRVPPVGCSVFTYSTTNSDSAAGELIIDGEIVGGLVGESGYYHQTVAQGPHAWVVVPSRDKSLPLLIARTRFECEEPRVAFLRYRNGIWGPKFEPVSVDRGQKDVVERWLAISSSAVEELPRSKWLRDGEVFVTKTGKSISAYQLREGDKIPRWGKSDLGEPCGMRAAIEDYKLSPVGSHTALQFAESLTELVQLRAVCTEGPDCRISSVFDGEYCDAESGTTIEFEPFGKLLVLQAQSGAYTELYYDDTKPLKKLAECGDIRCKIHVDELRNIGD